jgi:hypothetical protein
MQRFDQWKRQTPESQQIRAGFRMSHSKDFRFDFEIGPPGFRTDSKHGSESFLIAR